MREGKGPVVMGLSCTGLESEPSWAPGFQVTSGPKGGVIMGRPAQRQEPKALVSAWAQGTERNDNQLSLLFSSLPALSS